MLYSSCKAVSSAVAPHIHWITSCSSTSMHRPLSLGLGTTGTVDRKGHGWQPRNYSMGHRSHASKGILTAELTSPVPRADDCFSACRWYIHWTSDYFLIIFKLCSVWRLKYNITSAVHMITRSLKEHTGFTEIPGRLGKAPLLGQMMLFLKALMVLPLMDVTMNASNTFYGIVYQIWFHWIYCFYPWKNTFPGKQHLGLIDILQLSESPVIFLSFITPETCPVAITLASTQISLTGTLKSPKSGEWFAAALGSLFRCLMVQICGQHCGQAGSVVWGLCFSSYTCYCMGWAAYILSHWSLPG